MLISLVLKPCALQPLLYRDLALLPSPCVHWKTRAPLCFQPHALSLLGVFRRLCCKAPTATRGRREGACACRRCATIEAELGLQAPPPPPPGCLGSVELHGSVGGGEFWAGGVGAHTSPARDGGRVAFEPQTNASVSINVCGCADRARRTAGGAGQIRHLVLTSQAGTRARAHGCSRSARTGLRTFTPGGRALVVAELPARYLRQRASVRVLVVGRRGRARAQRRERAKRRRAVRDVARRVSLNG